MKKILTIFLFVFLTGLFTGLFFSTNMSEENTAFLSALLLQNLASPCEFITVFFSALTANIILAAIMLPAAFCRYLCPLPPAILLFKGFTTGFCCGLLYMSTTDNAFIFSLVKLFPQNIFFVPSFIIAASALFYASVKGIDALGSAPTRGSIWSGLRPRGRGKRHVPQKNRLLRNGSLLLYILIIAAALIIAGALTEALLHQVALLP